MNPDITMRSPSPHPDPLPSRGERRGNSHRELTTARERVELAPTRVLANALRAILPLPGGEGRGEGERYTFPTPIRNLNHRTTQITL
jgi:hypothetical protein